MACLDVWAAHPKKRASLSWMRMMPDCDLILFRVLLFGFDKIFNQRLGGYNEGMTT